MKKFLVTIDWNYNSYDRAKVEIEAEPAEAAEAAALELDMHQLDWEPGNICDGDYEIVGVVPL
jgi:hypothetical protein